MCFEYDQKVQEVLRDLEEALGITIYGYDYDGLGNVADQKVKRLYIFTNPFNTADLRLQGVISELDCGSIEIMFMNPLPSNKVPVNSYPDPGRPEDLGRCIQCERQLLDRFLKILERSHKE